MAVTQETLDAIKRAKNKLDSGLVIDFLRITGSNSLILDDVVTVVAEGSEGLHITQ